MDIHTSNKVKNNINVYFNQHFHHKNKYFIKL